jgi:hypothetical protein
MTFVSKSRARLNKRPTQAKPDPKPEGSNGLARRAACGLDGQYVPWEPPL